MFQLSSQYCILLQPYHLGFSSLSTSPTITSSSSKRKQSSVTPAVFLLATISALYNKYMSKIFTIKSVNKLRSLENKITMNRRTNKLNQHRKQLHRETQQRHQFHHHHHLHHHHHYTHYHTPQLHLPGFKTTSLFTILTLVCLETVLLSTVSNCAKTFYMHWNTSNSIFRIDNTDHIIDVNKGNQAFEFDQVHIICPVYEPGTFENETERYIIYNVSKVEYETCRITNTDPRVIAVCDKPHKLMFFTITFRPFTPQPGGLEFLPGNDYYFISTSSKDNLRRRIGGRCSTNNMKVVFKVCCAPEDINNRTNNNIGTGTGVGIANGGGGGNNVISGGTGTYSNTNNMQPNNINMNNAVGGGQLIIPKMPGMGLGGAGTPINTNIDQFNRISMQQPNMIGGTNANGGGYGMGMDPGMSGQHPTGIRINNIPPSQHPQQKNGMHGGYMSPMGNINTNSSNVVQNTISWPDWGNPHFYPSYITSPRPNTYSGANRSNYSPSFKSTNKAHDYDKHPNEVVKNEELTYNTGTSYKRITRRRTIITTLPLRKTQRFAKENSHEATYHKFKSILRLLLFTCNYRNKINILNFIYHPCTFAFIIIAILVAVTNLIQYKFLSYATPWFVVLKTTSTTSPSKKFDKILIRETATTTSISAPCDPIYSLTQNIQPPLIVSSDYIQRVESSLPNNLSLDSFIR